MFEKAISGWESGDWIGDGPDALTAIPGGDAGGLDQGVAWFRVCGRIQRGFGGGMKSLVIVQMLG